jgi:hypothetical protein
VAQLEALLPGLQIDVEAMKASDWVRGGTGSVAAAAAAAGWGAARQRCSGWGSVWAVLTAN